MNDIHWIGERMVTCLAAWEQSSGRFASHDFSTPDGCRYCGAHYIVDGLDLTENPNARNERARSTRPSVRYDDGMTDDKAWREAGYFRLAGEYVRA